MQSFHCGLAWLLQSEGSLSQGMSIHVEKELPHFTADPPICAQRPVQPETGFDGIYAFVVMLHFGIIKIGQHSGNLAQIVARCRCTRDCCRHQYECRHLARVCQSIVDGNAPALRTSNQGCLFAVKIVNHAVKIFDVAEGLVGRESLAKSPPVIGHCEIALAKMCKRMAPHAAVGNACMQHDYTWAFSTVFPAEQGFSTCDRKVSLHVHASIANGPI